ncbi:MAG: hypothetical protein ACPMAQ_04870 [Phycisphaerae bacterium]
MTDLDRMVRLAQRRLWLNRWLRLLGWSATVAAGTYVLVALTNKLFSLTEHPCFYSGAAMGAAGAALLISTVWFIATRDDRPTAAATLDLAAGLKERISSGLYCAGSADPFARAVYEDARRISRSISPRAYLRVVFPRSGHYAFATVALALVVSFAIPPMDLLGRQEEHRVAEVRQESVQQTRAVVAKTFEQVKKLANENPLLQKMDGLKELDPLAEPKAESPLDVKQDAIKKIDNLVKNVHEQQARAERERVEAVKKMLRRASDLQQSRDSAMDKLNQAMASGDFQAAREAIRQMQEKLAQTPQTPEQKQQAEAIRQQLAQMAERLEKAAAAQTLDRKLAEELRKAGINTKEIEKKLAGLSKEDLQKLARQLQQKGLTQQQAQELVKKLQQQSEARQACRKMADGLAKAAQGMNLAAGGAQGLAMAAEQLSELEQAQQNLDQLQLALESLEDMKSQLGKACSQCNGTGMCNGKPCSACGGSGCSMGDAPGQGGGSGRGMGGLGRGQGGIAPVAETPFRTKRERTPVITGRGSLIGQSWVQGEQIKGQATAEYVGTAISAERDAAEAIHEEKVPRQYRKTVGTYFKRIAEDAKNAAGSESAATPDGQK